MNGSDGGIADLLEHIRSGQQRLIELQERQLELAREQLERSRAQVEESLALQRQAIARQRTLTAIGLPAIALCVVAILYLTLRYF